MHAQAEREFYSEQKTLVNPRTAREKERRIQAETGSVGENLSLFRPGNFEVLCARHPPFSIGKACPVY
jgi:hypothetical protein